jgi:hypothetical protein
MTQYDTRREKALFFLFCEIRFFFVYSGVCCVQRNMEGRREIVFHCSPSLACLLSFIIEMGNVFSQQSKGVLIHILSQTSAQT